MILIVIGSIFVFFGVIGIIVVATGQAVAGALIAYLAFLALGIFFILLGNRQQKEKHMKGDISQGQDEKVVVPPPVDEAVPDDSAEANYGLVLINWEAKTMMVDYGIRIYVDDKLSGIVNFASGAKLMIPLIAGSHKISADLGAIRKTEIRAEVKAGQSAIISLQYSRAMGSLKFTEPVYQSMGPIDIGKAVRESEHRKQFVRTVMSHLNGRTLVSISDRTAILRKNPSGIVWFFLWILGILPAVICLLVRSFNATLLILELHDDGSVTSFTVSKKKQKKG